MPFIVKCPYRGHRVDLEELDPKTHTRSEEYRCPVCDEWVFCGELAREPFMQQPYPKNSSIIRHPERYQCLVDSKKWYDKDLKEVECKDGRGSTRFAVGGL